MIIAKITGNIVSTIKYPDYEAHKLFIVRQVGVDGNVTGPELVALNGVEVPAGVGDIVLVDQEGGGARQLAEIDHIGPIEATIAAVVDHIDTSKGGFSQF